MKWSQDSQWLYFAAVSRGGCGQYNTALQVATGRQVDLDTAAAAGLNNINGHAGALHGVCWAPGETYRLLLMLDETTGNGPTPDTVVHIWLIYNLDTQTSQLLPDFAPPISRLGRRRSPRDPLEW